jgi:hypothetical protein
MIGSRCQLLFDKGGLIALLVPDQRRAVQLCFERRQISFGGHDDRRIAVAQLSRLVPTILAASNRPNPVI